MGGGCSLHSGRSMLNGGHWYLWHIYDMAMIVVIMMGFLSWVMLHKRLMCSVLLELENICSNC